MFRLKNQIHLYSCKKTFIRSLLLAVVVKNHRSSCDLDAATLTNLPLVRERVCVCGGRPSGQDIDKAVTNTEGLEIGKTGFRTKSLD